MSAPLAGKFQDHYALLGVDPKCEQEAIKVAYDRMVEKYDPKNKQTGDVDKFETVKLAFEVLSDPLLRAEFNKVKGIEEEESNLLFSGHEFFEQLGRQTGLRVALMCILYDRRRKRPLKPALSIRQVESAVAITNDELVFSLFYLKQRGLVQSDDKSNLQITVDGMEHLERDRPAPEDVFPFLKASAMPASTRTAAPKTAPTKAESTKIEFTKTEFTKTDSTKTAHAKTSGLAALSATLVSTEEPAEVESVSKILTRALARR